MGNNIAHIEIESENGSVIDFDPEKEKLRKYHRSKFFLYKFFKCFYKKKIGNANYENIIELQDIYECEI